MIDLHSHVLPGLDDGARDLDASVAMARAAREDGVSVLAATPHVRDDYRTTPEQMEDALARVREAVGAEGIDIEILPGGEIALDELARLGRDDLRRFGLGGNPDVVLLEFPYYGVRLDIAQRVFELRTNGITPVIAHPERNPAVWKDVTVVAGLVAAGALVQVTAASLDGRLGRRPRGVALGLIAQGLAHMVASDAHAPEVRAIGMSSAAAAIGDQALARWLTHEVPRALLDGRSLPARPQTQPARRKRFGAF
jgi:protein-tyrosine phosphatase